MKQFSSICLVAVVIVLLLTGSSRADNVILNGGFEDDLTYWDAYQYPSGWTTSTTNPHSGQKCAVFTFPGGAGYYDAAMRTSSFEMYVVPDVLYRFTLWTREIDTHDTWTDTESILDATVSLNGSYAFHPLHPSPSESWQQWELIGQFEDSGYVTVYLELHGYATSGAAEFAVDDVILERIPAVLSFPSIAVSPCDDAQPVMLDLSQPINGAIIPIRIPDGAEFCGLTTDGLFTEDWEMAVYYNGDSTEISVGLWNLVGDRIPSDTTTVVNVLFHATPECETSYYLHWDTAFMGDPQHELLFSDTNDFDLAGYFDPDVDSTEIEGYIPGDVNGDGEVNIADLTYLVAYLFTGGPPPCVMNAGDVNGSCTGPNIADLTYLVSYLFTGGPAPVCGCLGEGAAMKVSSDISLITEYHDGTTTITLNSNRDLRGLQLTFAGDGVPQPLSLLDSRIELMSGTNIIGLADLEGEAVIQSGTQSVIRLEGEYEIVEAIASDMNHNEVVLAIGAPKEESLPCRFVLDQNYPNPFNPTTAISFSLPNAGEVRLEVFNVMGQQVATLVNHHMEAGSHTVTWDSRDNSGHNVASGVYFYRLEAGSINKTKKMVLLK
ncbi:MAG: T9SS type A sorting domain-containing protein [candidate division Zixibacteria bacterium]|nr:T9SS type A sorting domain-containing protein [candidate division Zixibacteria bacterium]